MIREADLYNGKVHRAMTWSEAFPDIPETSVDSTRVAEFEARMVAIRVTKLLHQADMALKLSAKLTRRVTIGVAHDVLPPGRRA